MPTVDTIQTGNNIKGFMKDQGVTVKDIQTAFGFNTPTAIYKWLKGATMPTIDNIVMIADIFGVGINDIVAIKRV